MREKSSLDADYSGVGARSAPRIIEERRKELQIAAKSLLAAGREEF
jgi:hypothetical protein